ncbi:MAG: hypothetical protein IPK82_00850 [Polyangiaceae bacterium]|nr:hypothetical protein [Polyangiaceae bacterium]
MSDEGNIEFKVAILGPRRVGKTSLITALLSESQKLLAGTPVSIASVGTTEARIAQHKNDLRGSLLAGEFHPGALGGTQAPFTFTLSMSVNKTAIVWAILDYPGGWLDARTRGSENDAEWERCKRWISESPVLLLPVDASVLMEATLKREKITAQHLLQIGQTEEMAREWAKGRAVAKQPGLVVIAPVKCESYFNDNGGLVDKNEELYRRVVQAYKPVIDAVRQEMSGTTGLSIQYHPVDTFGCVELQSAEWRAPDGSSEQAPLLFSATYIVRPPGQPNPKGAGGILVSICRQIVEAQSGKGRGFLSELWAWLTGGKRRLRQAVEDLSAVPLGNRVRML